MALQAIVAIRGHTGQDGQCPFSMLNSCQSLSVFKGGLHMDSWPIVLSPVFLMFWAHTQAMGYSGHCTIHANLDIESHHTIFSFFWQLLFGFGMFRKYAFLDLYTLEIINISKLKYELAHVFFLTAIFFKLVRVSTASVKWYDQKKLGGGNDLFAFHFHRTVHHQRKSEQEPGGGS